MANIRNLFSYRRAEAIELDNIRNNVAYFGNISNFNDPEEGVVYTQLLHNGFGYFDPKEVLRAGRRLYREIKTNWLLPEWLIEDMRVAMKADNDWSAYLHLNKIVDKMQKYRDNMRVLCLTPIDNNALMWAHYANSHKGICVEYELDYSNLPKGLSSIAINYTSATKIYSCSELIFSPDEVIARLCFTKKTEWSYEDEWRIIETEGKSEYTLNDKFKLISVTCGLRTPNKDEVRELCRLKNIKYYEIENKNVYGLSKVEIDPSTGRVI